MFRQGWSGDFLWFRSHNFRLTQKVLWKNFPATPPLIFFYPGLPKILWRKALTTKVRGYQIGKVHTVPDFPPLFGQINNTGYTGENEKRENTSNAHLLFSFVTSEHGNRERGRGTIFEGLHFFLFREEGLFRSRIKVISSEGKFFFPG